MPIDRYRLLTALAALAGAAGCAGNGQGLDQNGNPIGSSAAGPSPLTADFQSIQDHVFTPICSACHIGASAPQGLRLDAANSYNLLVGAPSVEIPALLRVKAGDPDNSYLVRKIQGHPDLVGGQMPLGETPLPQATIDAIRQWITDGAAKPQALQAALLHAAGGQFAIASTEPLNGALVTAPLERILVAFTQEVDASLLNDTTVALQRIAAPGAGDFGLPPGSAEGLAATAALAGANPTLVVIVPRAPLGPGTYRVTLRGTGGGALADVNGIALAADDSFLFTVEPVP